MNKRTKEILGGLVLAGVLVCGCGPKRVTTSEVPIAPMGVPPPVKPKSMDRYVVRKHDTLWAIAGKSSIYGDSFEWPLIYKSNRDIIQDPDLIYARQKFMIVQGLDSAQVKKAEKMASDTPKYVPHSQPRKGLPVNYF